MKRLFAVVLTLFLFLNLLGCNQTHDAQYNEYIQSGLDYLALEDYIRAEIKFEQALSIKPENPRASAHMVQSSHFNSALNAIDNGNDQLAITEANLVIREENGSQALIVKAGLLIDELGNSDPLETMEETEIVDNSKYSKEEVGLVQEVEEVVVSDTVNQAEETYNYEEIEGYYAFFEGEAHNSDILVTFIIEEDRFIEIIPSWNEILVYDISSKTVVNDRLNIDYERIDPYSDEFESSDISAMIQKLDYTVTSLIVNGDDYHKLTAGQIIAYGMELPSHLSNDN